MTEETTRPAMPNFWWCPTHHLYRGGDKRPCADAVRLVPEACGDTDLVTEDNRIRDRIRAVLSDPMLDEATMLDQVNAILDSAPPAPRVWFPGDTVPAESAVMDGDGRVMWSPNAWTADASLLDIDLPSLEEWHAAVDRARDAREESLRADRHAEITEAEASEARDG